MLNFIRYGCAVSQMATPMIIGSTLENLMRCKDKAWERELWNICARTLNGKVIMCFLTGLYKLYYNTRILSLFAYQDWYLAFLQKNNYVFELFYNLLYYKLQIFHFNSFGPVPGKLWNICMWDHQGKQEGISHWTEKP